MSRPLRRLLLVCCALLAGCPVINGTNVLCDNDQDCPPQYYCGHAQKCVLGTPALPAISDVKTDRDDYSDVSPYNVVTLTFDTSEDLDVAPAALTVTLGTSAMQCAPWQAMSPSYTCTYDVLPKDSEGAQTITIVGANAHGSSTQTTSVVFDFSPPTIQNVKLNSTLFSANPGFNSVVLTFDTAKPASSATATIGNKAMTCGTFKTASPNYTCSYTVSTADSEGTQQITISAGDDVGNTAAAMSSVAFDFTPPSLTSSSAVPQLAGVGQTETVTLAVSEALGSSPLFSATTGSTPLTFSTPTLEGMTYTLTHQVSSSDTSGAYTSSVTLVDLVGNTATVAGPSFGLITTGPGVQNLMTNGSAFSAMAGFNQVEITFQTSESITIPPGTITAAIGNQPMTCSPVQGSSTSFACKYTVVGTEPSGIQTINVSVTDDAGNTSTGTTSVTFDFTAPVITNVAANGSEFSAATGFNQVQVTFNAAVAAAPGIATATIGGMSMSCQPSQGTLTQFSCSYTVMGTETPGSQAIDIVVTDAVGNGASNAATSVAFDFTPPTIANVTLNGSLFSAMPGFNLVTVTFDTAEPVSTDSVTVSVGGWAMNCRNYQTAQPNFACTYTVTGGETAGLEQIDISAVDGVGNVATSMSSSVTFDFTPPSLISSGAVPPLAGLGKTEVVTLMASKPLGIPPSLSTSGSLMFTVESSSGQIYTLTHSVTASDASGHYSTTASLTDVVGNQAMVPGPSFVLDTVVPMVEALATNASVFSAVTGFNQVTATFSTSEAIVAPGNVSATLEASPMTCQGVSGSSTSFSCGYTVTGQEPPGDQTIGVTVTDAAGNTSSGTVGITFDFTPPSILSQTASPTLAGVGQSVTLAFTVSEPLSSAPSVVTSGPGLLSFIAVPSTTYSVTHLVSATDASGTYSTTVMLVDTVGNTATLAGPSFAIDTNSPTITDLATTSSVYSAVSGFNEIIATFNTAKSVSTPGASLSVTVGGSAMMCGTYQAASPNYTCTYSVTGSEGTGSQAIDVLATDEVGNTASATLNVTFDFVVPTISAVTVGASLYSAVPGYNLVSVAFDTAKSVSTQGSSLSATIGGIAMSCGTYKTGSPNYTCTYTVTGKEPSGTQTIALQAVDEVGNTSTAQATTAFQFTPPTLSGAPVVLYTPPATSPITTATAATIGSVINLTFTTTEPLGPTPTVTVGMTPASLPFSELSGPMYAATATVSSTWLNGLPDGTYQLSFTLTDTVGNTETSQWPTVVIVTEPPVVLNTSATGPISYARIPWGSSATSGVASFTVKGTSGAATGDAAVAVYSGTTLLGTGTVKTNGSFTASCGSSDHASVSVAAVDHAGNVSAASAVHSITWTATFGGKTPGNTTTNPHMLEAAQDLGLNSAYVTSGTAPLLGTVAQSPLFAAEASSYTGVELPADGVVLPTTMVSAPWENVTPPSNAISPGIRRLAAMAYDSVRGVTVLYGGFNDTTSTYIGDTWEWNGLAWTQVSTTGPAGRDEVAMAYDSARGVTVLFGGFNKSGALQDTWEWNGSVWTQVTAGSVTTANTPAARGLHSMAYDSVHGVTVLFGGESASNAALQDTWEWNGSIWTQVTAATITTTNTPLARFGAAMSFDAARTQVLLFGGENSSSTVYSDTWAWNGTTWAQLAPAASPTGRYQSAMAYDAIHGNTILFGGYVGGADNTSWSWGGTTWTKITPTSSLPPARNGHAAAFDQARGVTVIFGGLNASGADLNDTWLGNTAAGVWTNVTPSPTSPSPRSLHSMAFDVGRGQTVMFGGLAGTTEDADTWTWSGNAWTSLSPTTVPPKRCAAAMVYDAAQDVSLLFGGDGASGMIADSWTWNGTNWTTVLSISNPSARQSTAIAYDTSHSVAVLFGGNASAGLQGDTWTWNGANDAWTNANMTGPPARYSSVMAFDSARAEAVLFGGLSVSSDLADTWFWTESSGWNIQSPGSNPVARQLATMVYDSARDMMVLFGGSGSTSLLADTWLWTGSTWASTTIPATNPPARGAAAAVYDTARSETVLFGGAVGGTPLGDTWVLPSDVAGHPGQIAQFSFAAANATSPVIQQMTFTAYTGATGNTLNLPGPGATQSGTTLAVWNAVAGNWKALASNTTDSSATPTVMTYPTASAAEAQGYLETIPQLIQVAVFPTAGRGNGVTPPVLDVDYLELDVTYQQ